MLGVTGLKAILKIADKTNISVRTHHYLLHYLHVRLCQHSPHHLAVCDLQVYVTAHGWGHVLHIMLDVCNGAWWEEHGEGSLLSTFLRSVLCLMFLYVPKILTLVKSMQHINHQECPTLRSNHTRKHQEDGAAEQGGKHASKTTQTCTNTQYSLCKILNYKWLASNVCFLQCTYPQTHIQQQQVVLLSWQYFAWVRKTIL